MNPRYGTQNSPTSILKLLHVSTHRPIIGFHFWKHTWVVLYASYLCLSPIYCLNHVECFRFFMAANIDFVWRRFEASLQLACDLLSICLRHAHASLRPGLQPGLQLARRMECGLNAWTGKAQPFHIGQSSTRACHFHFINVYCDWLACYNR